MLKITLLERVELLQEKKICKIMCTKKIGENHQVMVKIFNESRSMRYRIPRGETALLGWYKDDDGLCPRASRRMSHLLEAGWPRIEKKTNPLVGTTCYREIDEWKRPWKFQDLLRRHVLTLFQEIIDRIN